MPLRSALSTFHLGPRDRVAQIREIPGNPWRVASPVHAERQIERETVVHDGAVLVVSCQTRHGLVRCVVCSRCTARANYRKPHTHTHTHSSAPSPARRIDDYSRLPVDCPAACERPPTPTQSSFRTTSSSTDLAATAGLWHKLRKAGCIQLLVRRTALLAAETALGFSSWVPILVLLLHTDCRRYITAARTASS